MSDRGEKIVLLAKEFLDHQKCGTSIAPCAQRESQDKRLTVKAVYLAALLAAAGGAGATHIAHEMNRPVNRYECVEIQALIFYAAREFQTSVYSIKQEMTAALSLDLDDIQSVSDYRRARDYLRDRLLNTSRG